jgi:hypothetical protein
MSTASGAIGIETRVAGGEADVCAALSRLAFRRRLWQSVAVWTFGASLALALLCLLGALDFLRPLPQAARVSLVGIVLLALLLFFAHAAWKLISWPTLFLAAREIERAAGLEGNALATLCERLDGAAMTESAPYMLARLRRQAREQLAGLDERRVAPRRRATGGALALGFMLLLLLLVRVLSPAVFALEAQRLLRLTRDEAGASRASLTADGANAVEVESAIVIEELRVRVVPPAYTGLGAEDAPGDGPVRALAGSQVLVSLRARGDVAGASLSFNGAASPMRLLGEGHFTGAFTASASGALEARVVADERYAPAPFVRGVEVYADAPPEARITEPGGDQLLRAIPGAPVRVAWTARDDFGLSGVTLKYIKSRGEGDAARFTDGELRLSSVERASLREWQGTASLDLARLGLQAGDTLVFWIEARDRSPNANNAGRSASLAIAIRAPEAARLSLSDLLPGEIGRFRLSQRQIIIKTEKLHAERARLTEAEVLKRSNDIAADQRDFKNSFNEYIKREGAGEDEGAGAVANGASVEAEARALENERTATHFHGIPEPPAGAPTQVREMVAAIRAMWDAEEALSIGDTTKALAHEREALTHLNRAQTAVRYIPPIVAQSKPVDLKRRYAGELAEIRTRLEKLARRPQSKESAQLQAALADAYAALGDLQATLDVPASGRSSATARARQRARQAADRLVSTGGEHAAIIAEAAGQLRIVEMELSRLEYGGTADEYAARLGKPLALLAQAAANLYAIAASNTRAGSTDAGARLLSSDDARASEYFRRILNGGLER